MMTIRTWEITLDALALTDDANANDDAIARAFVAFAASCGVTVTNVRRVESHDWTFSAYDWTCHFDATTNDVRLYEAVNDCEIDAANPA